MGYRLEVYNAEYSCCGGKLFGYIKEEDLPKCKSWMWLKEHGYLDDEYERLWNYGVTHTTALTGHEYKEFIKLYVEDYTNYGFNDPVIVQELTKSLDCDDDKMKIITWE